MQGIDVVQIEGKEITILDNSNCNEGKMIELMVSIGSLIQSRNKPTLVLVIYDEKSYVTPKYMRQVERTTGEVIHLIDDIAFIGLTFPRQMILKGYNFLFNRNFKSFNSKEEALAYLINDKK